MNALWTELKSLRNLFDAASRAAEGKKSRPDVAAFRANLEPELFRLQRQLADGSYRPCPYRTFRIVDPKPRLISAAPFRDRVVHHALTNIVEPIFERRFVPYSFACREGFVNYKALARRACARYSCVLKLDVRKCFPSRRSPLSPSDSGRPAGPHDPLSRHAPAHQDHHREFQPAGGNGPLASPAIRSSLRTSVDADYRSATRHRSSSPTSWKPASPTPAYRDRTYRSMRAGIPRAAHFAQSQAKPHALENSLQSGLFL